MRWHVEHFMAREARAMAERLSDVRLADAALADKQDVLLARDECSGG
jgi:hypothetical protein